MPFYPAGFGLGEDGGFALINPSGTFNAATQAAGETARNTYASNNASWLAELDANPSLLVRLTWPTTPTNAAFYGRANSSWVNLTALLAQAGPAGPAGPNGRQGIWWAQVWQAAASVPASAPTTYSIAASGAITNLDNDWLNAPPATVADGEAVYTALTLVNPASVTFPVTSGLTWSAVIRLTGEQGPAGPAGSGGGGGFDYNSLVRLSAPALGDDLAAWDTSAGVWKKLSLTALRTLVQRTAAQLRTAIGNATSSVAGLMSAADKTKLDGLDKEQIRIDEFIDADNVAVMDGYSIVASYTGSVNGTSIFAQDTYSIYYQDSNGMSRVEFLRHVGTGWQFLLHRQSTPPQYVFSDVTAVEWQDTNGNATTVLADTVTFKFTVAIDAERGLDAYGELTPGTVRLHWKIPLDRTYVEVDGSNVTPELVEAIQGNNEDEDLGNFTRVAIGLEQSGDNRFSVNGSSSITFSVAGDANYADETSGTNDAKLYRAAKERAWIRFGNGWEIEIVALSQRYTGSGGRAQYLITSWNVLSGTAPGLNSSTSVKVIGEDVHRGQIAEAAFRDSAENVAGKGGTAGQKWTRGSGDDDAEWDWEANEATLPSSPVVGQVFILTAVDGSNVAGFYYCRTAGTWTRVSDA